MGGALVPPFLPRNLWATATVRSPPFPQAPSSPGLDTQEENLWAVSRPDPRWHPSPLSSSSSIPPFSPSLVAFPLLLPPPFPGSISLCLFLGGRGKERQLAFFFCCPPPYTRESGGEEELCWTFHRGREDYSREEVGSYPFLARAAMPSPPPSLETRVIHGGGGGAEERKVFSASDGRH